MTIREELATRRRRLMVLAFLAWLGGGLSAIFRVKDGLPWLPLPFFALFGAAVLLHLYWLRCPRCRGPLGIVNASLTKEGGGLRRRINFCPYCGISLDEPWQKVT